MRQKDTAFAAKSKLKSKRGARFGHESKMSPIVAFRVANQSLDFGIIGRV
jgi:hypothetical protein